MDDGPDFAAQLRGAIPIDQCKCGSRRKAFNRSFHAQHRCLQDIDPVNFLGMDLHHGISQGLLHDPGKQGFALLLGVLGTLGLALRFNLLSAFLTLATLLIYVAIYTPLKRVSTFNTVVGAVPGAAAASLVRGLRPVVR